MSKTKDAHCLVRRNTLIRATKQRRTSKSVAAQRLATKEYLDLKSFGGTVPYLESLLKHELPPECLTSLQDTG